ncbi:MAG: sigma 54-interacting transcriptional regulator [Deltaproteobacteria bacterium]|nr:sigma 54-interacting transcriptional regulator [Kofleriaceae bacterium]
MRTRLVVVSGPDLGKEFSIPPEGGVVGRGEQCVMRLEDAAVSRQQFRIGIREGRPLVVDLGSTNRTKVNGQPIEMRVLAIGDRIEIGNSVLQVLAEDEAFLVPDSSSISDVADLSAKGSDASGALTTAALVGVALLEGPGVARACEQLVGLFGAERVQIIVADRGLRLIAGHGGNQGMLPLDQAQLQQIIAGGNAVNLRGVERETLACPFGAAGIIVVDRPAGRAWERKMLELLVAVSQMFVPAIASAERRERREAALATLADDGELDGDSAHAAYLREWSAWAARLPSALLVGEHGVGKQRVAAFIHRRSDRASGPFVVVHGGDVHDAWLATAHGGTLFFDELAALSPQWQDRLMSAIQAQRLPRADGSVAPFDVKLLAASCAEVGRFVRPDLLAHVAHATLVVPPLRERRGDITTIAEKMLSRLAVNAGFQRAGFSAGAAARLLSHHWPGNIRELASVVSRLVVFPGTDAVGDHELARAMF